MKEASKIRNFAVAGHSGSGKTTLCDLMLFKAKKVERLGNVDQKSSVSDYTADEHEKQSSIYATTLNCQWKSNDFMFIDTPGYGEFVGEVISSLRACDNALIVVDAVNGIEIGTTRAWKLARERGVPRFVLINRIDRERADFARTLTQLQEAYGKTVCVPITLPVGAEGNFSKVINVLKDTDIPSELADEVAAYREQLMDTIAESDEELMMRYLDGEQLSDEEISAGLNSAIISGDLVPVFAGSCSADIGISELMDGIVNFFPNPLARPVTFSDDSEEKAAENAKPCALVYKSVIDPFIGQLTFMRVYNGTLKSDNEYVNLENGNKERFGSLQLVNGKTTEAVSEACAGALVAMAKLKSTKSGDTLGAAGTKTLPPIKYPKPVMSYAITAVKSGEEEKIAAGLNKLSESDPTVKVHRDEETHELLLSGMGDQHLGNIIKKLKNDYKVEVNLASPKIPYRETITGSGEAQYRHKKQSGGHGQFGEVFLRIAPNTEGYEFANEVVGGNIPKNYIPAVEKGVVEAMQRGPLAGCVVQNMTVTVFDGKHHPVDSSEMAFKIASRMAFRKAMAAAGAVLLEPIMTVKIMIPDQYMGDITGDLNHKRGRILGMAADDGLQVVNAEVPLAEMARYATELRSMTQGRGSFEMDFERYEQVPTNVANEIISKFQAEQEEE